MWPEVIPSIRIAVGLVFAFAVAQKLRNPDRLVAKLGDLEMLPRELAAPAAALLIASELLVAAAHLSDIGIAIAAPATLALLGIFVAATGWALRRGAAIPCLCFGADHEDVVSSKTMARLTVLAAAEAVVWIDARSPASSREQGGEVGNAILVLAFALLGIVIVSWILSLPDIRDLLAEGKRPGRAGPRMR